MIKNVMTLGIKSAVEKIVSEVRTYESDTFSAEGSKLTGAEALAVVAKLIESNVQPGMNIDGLEITEALEEVRGL